MPKSAQTSVAETAKSRPAGASRQGQTATKTVRLGRPAAADAEFNVRERILDVAEEHFAKHGFDGVTTRAIAKGASTTTGMIHYYFNTKRALFDAVFARRADIVNKERLASLDAYETAGGAGVTVEGAIAAFLRPVMDKLVAGGEGWRNYMALVGWVGNTHEWGGEVMNRSFDPVVLRLIEVIRKALPTAREEDLYWGYHFLSGALVLTISETDRIDRLSKGMCRSTDIAAIEPRMVEFAAAGFKKICKARPRRA